VAAVPEALVREEGVPFQRVKTWKASRNPAPDPDHATKKARIEQLYAIADGEVIPDDGEPNRAQREAPSFKTGTRSRPVSNLQGEPACPATRTTAGVDSSRTSVAGLSGP
jgi:hypothetical protein